MQADRTLTETAREVIEDGLDTSSGRVLWWDDGGHLEEVIERVCEDIGVELRKANGTPLELRQSPSRDPQVWYVPHDKDGYDWFRDVENTGDVEEKNIEELAVRCFGAGNASSWEINDIVDDENRDSVARIIREELSGSMKPTFEELKTKILMDGHADPVRSVLRDGWEGTRDDEDSIEKIRNLLINEGVEPVKDETDTDEIVRLTRRWAIAEWLMNTGVDEDVFPEEYSSASDTYIPSLKRVTNDLKGTSQEMADTYLEGFWTEVHDLDDPWTASDCPVDGELDAALWRSWKSSFDDGEYELCAEKAEKRGEVIEEAFGEVSWAKVWEQAVDIATLARKIDEWNEEETEDVVEIYADREDGSWKIDKAVLNLVVSGNPESSLPSDHPPTEFLADLREDLVEDEYVDYLKGLASLTVEQVEMGEPFVEYDHAREFFDQEKDSLRSGQTVALFVIDALRLDLARELATQLRDRNPDFEVDEDTWIGTLPSETEFGKGALTPGSPMGFEVSLDDGDLTAKKNGDKLSVYKRNSFLEEEGWEIIRGDEGGWNNTRVAYYSNDIDDMGEKELSELESLLSQRVENLAQEITEKLQSGKWDKAYVLTDHGFVSLPTSVNIEAISRPDGTVDSSRRWIAGDVEEDDEGVLLDEDAHLGYLKDDVSILADPTKRFRKQSVSDKYFYHGGILPQEFVLDFLSISKE